MAILDEASEIRAYGQRLERKSQELEAVTNELRQANARLLELDRMKDDFVSSVTHELRTPLTSIRALSELLHDDPRMELAQRTRFLGIIVAESERLTRLVNQVLDLAKIESGNAEWCVQQVDLRQLIQQVGESTAHLFAGKNARLELALPSEPAWSLVDSDRMIQVLLNLISNAVKFIPAQTGLVLIRLKLESDQLQVDVWDNGPGISEQDQQIIFEKFRQGHGSNTALAKPAGTGLGLPISRQIIEHFGGKLWVESDPGVGSIFSFTLPRQRVTASPTLK
jgi:signal transduction histidine kinase